MSKGEDGRILCLCLNITAGDVRRAVEEGAETFAEVQRRTRCARSCGMCADTVRAELARLLRMRQFRIGGNEYV